MSHYFIAIPIPKHLKKLLSNWQIKHKEVLPFKQWTCIDDFHITLKFLGSMDREKLFFLQENLTQLNCFKKFVVKIGAIHTFGNLKTPRVLWVGVEKNESIIALHQFIERICSSLGFPEDNRAFQPHITLGKKWDGQSKAQLLNQVKKKMDLEYDLYVRKVVLYQINPKDTPKYKDVQNFMLSGR